MPEGESKILPVVRAKLHAPRIPSDIVCRGRLQELLALGPDRAFTLVSAPAGYGKSTLVARCLETAGVAGTWLSVEESDNDVRQFLTYLTAAVRNHSKQACGSTIELLCAPELPPLRILREQLSNDLEALRKPFVLVIDDFHLIDRLEIHEIVDHLLDFPPRALHLVIVTRRDPPLQLARLRASGKMIEVREGDLRFTEEETRTMLQQLAGIEIADEVLLHVHSELEGWIVGLRLVCLALRNRDDPEGFLRDLSGGTTTMQDYLAREVLSRLPDRFRQCLLSSAIVDRFCASLCEAVFSDELEADKDTGDHFLTQLLSENLFTIELDNKGEWFRFHHLFQRLLMNQLEAHATTEEIAVLHLRASAWFEEQGLVEGALKHALAANDVERGARLLEKGREETLKTDRQYVLEKWLTVLPEDSLQRHPALLLVRAWMFVHQYRYPLVLPLLDQVDALLSASGGHPELSGEIALLRGMSLTRMGDSRPGLEFLKAAVEQIPATSAEARAQAEVMFSLASQMEGKKDEAIRFLDEMMSGSPVPEGLRKSRLFQVYVFLHIISAHLSQAETANLPTGALGQKHSDYGEAWQVYLQGIIHLNRYELQAAFESLDYFRPTTSRRHIHFRRAAIDSVTCLILTCQLLGKTREAEHALQLLRDYVTGTDDPRLSVFIDSALARLQLLQGHPDSAIRWAETVDVSPANTMLWFQDIPSITACRVRIAEGSATSLRNAEKDLLRLAKLSETHHNDLKLIEILCLLAMACHQQGRREAAREHLDRALKLARPGGVTLPFVEWSPALAKVMLELVPRDSDWLPKQIREILSSSPAANTIEQPVLDALTNREFDVLEHLAKRLYDKEIGDELGISVETVKTHVKRIRGKLGVSSRREAVTEARRLGLLENHGRSPASDSL